jgi:hypothetical protein
MLTLGGCLLLGEVIVRGLLSKAEAFVARFHQSDDVVRRQLLALRLVTAAAYTRCMPGAAPGTAVAVAMPVILRKRRRFK